MKSDQEIARHYEATSLKKSNTHSAQNVDAPICAATKHFFCGIAHVERIAESPRDCNNTAVMRK
jgi:hypothetical protein